MDLLEDECVDNLTQPQTLDFEHSSWSTFQQDLMVACSSVFPKNPAQYTNGHVLLLVCFDDDLKNPTELHDLERQWKNKLNFTTEIWKIPSQRADNELKQKISMVKGEHGHDGKLLIVYYAGHGSHGSSDKSIWTA
jgi:hypothetical protein